MKECCWYADRAYDLEEENEELRAEIEKMKVDWAFDKQALESVMEAYLELRGKQWLTG